MGGIFKVNNGGGGGGKRTGQPLKKSMTASSFQSSVGAVKAIKRGFGFSCRVLLCPMHTPVRAI